MSKKNQKSKMKKARNLTAVSAHFRNSAGPIKDKKKEDNKNLCDAQVLETKEFDYYHCVCGHDFADHQWSQTLIDVFDRNTRCSKCLCEL